ncbi:FkbM family methyltransferase [Streptomyces sp. NPDC050564]|uniref:FkbM family methyltransferase n=1 Tax=Streptomyces sp. NPDC050564 TaxID=3365631 RepID=UPI00379BDCB8
MITVHRHGHRVRFPDVPNATEVPYTYKNFQTGSWYEERFLEHIRQAGRRGVYIDAGAHMGTATTWFAMLCPSSHVHAIEPVARFADQIERVIDANQLAEQVTLHRVGVSDESGTATNYLSPEHQTGFDPTGAPTGRDETFAVTTLDELIHDPVAVIKIDVEGMEDSVLKGASRILSTDHPTVYVEAWNRARLRDIQRVLKPFGYGLTGHVFNATPTYEFSTSAAAGASVRLAAHQLSHVAHRTLSKAAKRAGIR